MELIVKNEEELPEVAGKILEYAGTRRKFALTGDLGSGKTSLTQAVCRRLGVEEPVTSPTFSLVNEYAYADESGRTHYFYHIDLYRLNTVEEALEIGIEDYLYDDTYCFIEWPELIGILLPEDTVQIKITILRDSSRKILIL